MQESEAEIEDEVDILMSSDIVAAQMSTKNISFSRAQSGWLFKEDKSVSNYFYISVQVHMYLQVHFTTEMDLDYGITTYV